MTFSAVKIEFSGAPIMALPLTSYGEGNYCSPRPQLHLTLHYSSRIVFEKLSQTMWYEELFSACPKIVSLTVFQ